MLARTHTTKSHEYDLLVVGAGAGGMTAALVAAIEGLSVLVIEHGAHVGGTTARSSGAVWIPGNAHMRALGMTGDEARAHRYLDALVGEKGDRSLREKYIASGPAMIDYLAERSDVRFRAYERHPDYRQELPGAAPGGRPLEPLPFDGRLLASSFEHLGAPLRELMLFGGMMVTRPEAMRLVRFARSASSLALAVRLTSRFLVDRLRYSRGTRLVLGNALCARLYKGLLDRNVPVWLNAEPTALVHTSGRVCGMTIRLHGSTLTVSARRGIVLAGGGFPANAAMLKEHLPDPAPAHTPAFAGCDGSTIRLALAAGAVLGPSGKDNALWFPSSLARRNDGSTIVYPHIVLDRSKPGLVAVNSAGRRFVNEAVSYHEFVRGMYASHRSVPTIPATLIVDRRFIWKYGLGMIRPLTASLASYERSGYLTSAPSIGALAAKLTIDAQNLVETIRTHNEYAHTGKDAEFGKGENAYDINNGDAEHKPNACLGPIASPPYYAVRVVPTPLGTSLGLLTDTNARVLTHSGAAIPGLYACGNDMHSIMGGEYPGAGAQLGAAMTFGYIAARHAAAAASVLLGR